MFIKRKNRTALQRRAIRLVGAAMLLTVLFSIPAMPPALDALGLYKLKEYVEHGSALFMWSLATLSALPAILAIWVAASYLKAEPDEFIRALVTRAILWGFAVTMTASTFFQVFESFGSKLGPIFLINSDILTISTLIAFRLLERSYR